MNDKVRHFDITQLFAVMEANGWSEAKNFMKFWADGSAQIASVDITKKKSTIGANVNNGLRIYTLNWNWLDRFTSSMSKYREFLNQPVQSQAVRPLLANKYGRSLMPKDIVTSFNEWLVDGLDPRRYLQHIKTHQLQYILVNPYEMHGKKFNDLIAALNGFNFFAFYKGLVVNAATFRTNQLNCEKNATAGTKFPKVPCIKDPLARIPVKHRNEVEQLLKNPLVKSTVFVTHVGVYAGDVYEFNGAQYLATWNIVKNSVELSEWDYAWGNSDTDDPEDIAVTNETFVEYRKKTGKGGDFLALSPIRLTPLSIVLPVY